MQSRGEWTPDSRAQAVGKVPSSIKLKVDINISNKIVMTFPNKGNVFSFKRSTLINIYFEHVPAAFFVKVKMSKTHKFQSHTQVKLYVKLLEKEKHVAILIVNK